MSNVAICTSFYEAGRPYLDAYIAGIESARETHDVTVVAAIHGLDDPAVALAPLEGVAAVRRETVPAAASIAEVRGHMLRAGLDCGADILVLVDMDDYLLPDAIAVHGAALRDADFSYGDLALIDADGASLGRTFYQGCDIPARMAGASGRAAILGRNFLGFSNTALRRDCVDPSWLNIPDDLVAVDWWFFTMLLHNGRRGAKADAAVACYRTHDGNILGGSPDAAPGAVRRRIDIVCRHYAAFDGDPACRARRAALDRLADRIDRAGALPSNEIEAACAAPGVWFDDIARLADPVCST